MLFICNTTIEPDARDETMARFMEHGVVEPAGAKLQGAWVSSRTAGNLVRDRGR